MDVNAWVVFLHSDRLGFIHPECATQNALGDRYLTDLCPSNPEVRAYARALASDVARYEVSTILAESLHFHGLGHGYHHERYFEDLGTVGPTYLVCASASTASERLARLGSTPNWCIAQSAMNWDAGLLAVALETRAPKS